MSKVRNEKEALAPDSWDKWEDDDIQPIKGQTIDHVRLVRDEHEKITHIEFVTTSGWCMSISEYPSERAPGITPAHYGFLAECAAICLEERGHAQHSRIVLHGTYRTTHPLQWPPLSDQILRSSADPTEATEKGACAIAMAIVFEKTDLSVVERAAKGTGFDYWLGEDSADDTDIFSQTARLEVSGIRSGTEAQLEQRSREKTEQMQTSNTELAGYAIVVEFSLPQARISRR